MSVLGSAFGTTQGLTKNDNGTLRVGNRLPSTTPPKGEVVGDIWYNTSTLVLYVWDGTTWIPLGGSSSSGLWYYDAPNDAIAPSENVELLDKTLFLRGANDNCHRIRYASGTQGDLGSMDGPAILANGRGALFASGCGGGLWRLAWDNANDVVYIRSHISVGPVGAHFVDPESITTGGNGAGSHSGISMRSRSDSNIRWVEYPDSDQLRFWRNGSERVWFNEDGSVLTCHWDTNSSLKIGRWHANGAYGVIASRVEIESVNAAQYYMIGSRTDNNMFLGFRADPGSVFIRCANNGATVATFGNTNQGTGNDLNICLALPPIGGIVTQWSAGSHQFGYTPSAVRNKEKIRTLRETEDLDAGEHNPIFKLRPIRHKWKKWTHPGSPGLVNADEINSRHPNGVVGLLAEEVFEICPDAVHVKEAKPEWHWQEGDPLPETDKDGKPVLYKPAEPESIIGLDSDRLLAYVIDAVQFSKEEAILAKEEATALKEELKLIKEEIKNMKKDK